MTQEREGAGASTVDDDDEDEGGEKQVLRAGATSRYAVESEISRGGLGRVLRGRDHNLDRTVAIKQLIQHSARNEERFRREARITARLQHPSIVPIYETGNLSPGGEPFYAMKLVSGATLATDLAAATTLDARLGLVPKLIAVCDAIAYAHSERVIHRDLKPANVMVGPFGEVVVVDWGLAKDLDGETEPPAITIDGGDGLTREGTVMGTVPYLSPEQARGEPADERSDVYALGAILYHAFAGEQPYGPGKTAELLERVRLADPPPLGELDPGIPRELAAIVAQAMAREPHKRYANAGALVDDLRRFQTGQLVAAHRYSRGMLARRWLRRHRVVVAASTIAAIAIAVIATFSIRRVIAERDAARVARSDADVATGRAEAEAKARAERTTELLLAQARHWIDVDPTAALGWIRQYAAGANASPEPVRTIAVDAVERGAAHDLVRGLLATRLASEGTVLGYTDDFAVAIWPAGAAVQRISPSLVTRRPIAMRRDGRYVAWSAPAITVYDRTTSKTWTIGGGDTGAQAKVMTFVGDQLAVGRKDGKIDVIPLAGGDTRTFSGHTAPVYDLVAAENDKLLASAAADNTARVWTVDAGTARVFQVEATVDVMVFSHHADRFALSGQRTALRWVDLASPAVHTIGHGDALGSAIALAFSPDDRVLASGGPDARVHLDDLATGKDRALPAIHTDWINTIAFDRDGKVLVSAQSHGGPMYVWDLETGDRTTLLGHTSTLNLLAISPEHELVTGDRQTQVRRWTIGAARERVIERDVGDVTPVIDLPDGGLVGTHHAKPVVWHDLAAPAHAPVGPGLLSTMIAATADRSRLYFGDRDGSVWQWTLATDAAVRIDKTNVEMVALSPDGTTLAIGGTDGAIRIVALGEHPIARELGTAHRVIQELAFAPDGKHVASATADQRVLIWDVATGESKTVGDTVNQGRALAYLPDGRLAVGRSNGIVEIIAADGVVKVLRGHTASVGRLAVLDADTLASAGDDGGIRVWTVSTGASKAIEHGPQVVGLAALPGGWLVTGNAVDEGAPASIRLWNAKTGTLAAVWRGPLRSVSDFAVLSDGKHLASACGDGSLRIWPLPSISSIPAPTQAWLATLSRAHLDDHDVVTGP